MYRNKLQEKRVQSIVNRRKIKFEPYGGLFDQAFSQFNEKSINNPEPHSLTENYETPKAKFHDENDLEDKETNKPAIPNFMP